MSRAALENAPSVPASAQTQQQEPGGGNAADMGESDESIIADIMSQRQSERDAAAESADSEGPATTGASKPRTSKPKPSVDAEDEDTEQQDDSSDEDPDGVDWQEDLPEGERFAAAQAALDAKDLKKACLLAFGKVPEFFEVNNAKWTAFRHAQERAVAKVQKREQDVDSREKTYQANLQQVVQQLTPYANLHQLKQQYEQTHDTGPLVKMVEELTGASWNDFQKAVLHGQRLNPGQQKLQRELDEVRQELARRRQQEEQQAQARTAAETRAADVAQIAEMLKHERVSRVPKYAERVYRVLESTMVNGRLSMSVEQAGERVLKAERDRVRSSPFFKQEKREPAAESAAPAEKARARPSLRRDSQNNGAQSGEETDDQIINDIIGQQRRARLQAQRLNAKEGKR